MKDQKQEPSSGESLKRKYRELVNDSEDVARDEIVSRAREEAVSCEGAVP